MVFSELITVRFFEDPKMSLLWHRCKKTTTLFLRVKSVNQITVIFGRVIAFVYIWTKASDDVISFM